jgi:hypothetical protein
MISSDNMLKQQSKVAVMTQIRPMLMLLLLSLGLMLLLITVQVALVNTLLIFVFITVVGVYLCRFTAIRLADKRLNVLGTFWLIKVGMTLFLLYAGWIPQLDPSSVNWGYDPQRYYFDSYDLIQNGWNPLAANNYQGIIFYYGSIFYLFGHNPVIPALINAFVTLLGTLYLIRLAYELQSRRTMRDWTIAYLLLIPEFLWYDVMTSRETLAATLVIVSILTFGRFFASPITVSLVRTLLIGLVSIIFLLLVRTSIAIPVVLSIFAFAIFLRGSRQMSFTIKFFIFVFAFSLLAFGSQLQQLFGGSDVGAADLISIVESRSSTEVIEGATGSNATWSQNSVGMLLLPHSVFQSILFTFPRAILYLVSPLPAFTVPIADLINGSWSAWQKLFVIQSSVLYILALPYSMAGFLLAYKQRKQYPGPLVFHISFWITLLAIAAGNVLIHERYRLMMTLLLFASAWLGYTSCTKKQVKRFAVSWYGLLVLFGSFYMIYKLT